MVGLLNEKMNIQGINLMHEDINKKIDEACYAFKRGSIDSKQYSILFNAIAKDRGIDINHGLLELSVHDLEEWTNNRIAENNNANSSISD